MNRRSKRLKSTDWRMTGKLMRKKKNPTEKAKIKPLRLWIVLGTVAVVFSYAFAEVSLVKKLTGVSDSISKQFLDHRQHRLENHSHCSPTTRYSLLRIDQDSHAVILQSHHGSREKTIGGDEFYPTIVFDNTTSSGNEQVLAVGHVSDLSNGRYAVVFKSLLALDPHDSDNSANVNVEAQLYNISLSDVFSGYFVKNILQYSCGDGLLPPPSKEFRNDSGAVNREVPIQYSSSWLPIKKPTQQSRPQIDLKKFDRVLALGDSMMRQLVEGALYARKDVAPPWTYTMILAPLSSDQIEKSFLDPVRKACQNANALKGEILLGNDTDRLSLPAEGACSTNRTLLLLNSGMWDLLEDGTLRYPSMSQTCCNFDSGFENHLKSLRSLLLSIQSSFPNVTIGWKSMTAAHVHRVDCGTSPECMLRTKYMSTSRSERIFQKQLRLLKEEFPDVLIANVYDLTYSLAQYSQPGDGRHYLCKEDNKNTNVCLNMWNEAFGDSGWA